MINLLAIPAAIIVCAIAPAAAWRPIPSHAVSTATAAEDSNIRCAANPRRSVEIPFTRIHPEVELVPPHQQWNIRGPRMSVVVTDSTMWPVVWRAAVDSVTTPAVAFGQSAVILVATSAFADGPTSIRVTAIRECQRTGVVVLSTVENRPASVARPMRSRAIDVVRVDRGTINDRVLLFDQHVRFGPRQDD